MQRRLRELIRDARPQTSLAAVRSAQQLGMPLQPYAGAISSLLDRCVDDPLPVLELIAREGNSLSSLTPKIRRKLTAATADEDLLNRLNDAIDQGQLADRNGESLKRRLDAALVDSQREYAVPIHDEIPSLIPDELIPLSQVCDSGA